MNLKVLFALPQRLQLQLMMIALSLVAICLSFLFQALPLLSPDLPLQLAIFFCGIPSIYFIVRKLAKGDLGADSLAIIALVTAVILNQTLAAVIIILMLASGQAFEAYAMRKASYVLQLLAERMPTVVHRRVDGAIKDFPLQETSIGDIVVIYPHETCPVDGVVVEGHGRMDESYLTGEPYQVSKTQGSPALSGAINGNEVLTVKVEKLPADSRYTTIVKVLQEAEQKRPRLRRLSDQIGAIFAPLSLLFAFVVWYMTGDAIRFLSVLVIATPCPLLIAIPITIISAISIAARQSIIIRDPTVLERLPTCRTAIFDKTGTLTCGQPALSEILTADQVDANFILQMAASLERYSKHPLAMAIIRAAKKNHLPLLNATRVTEKPGEGLTGLINQHEINVTQRKILLKTHPSYSSLLPPIASGLECMIMDQNQYAATMRFHDLPRADSKPFITHLAPAHQFNKIMLVSGDRESEVSYLARELHVAHVYASQSPEQKLALVREECEKAPTLFMGDGINDAPALTAATVGIAFGEYSNVTAAAAGAVIMETTLQKVDELIHLSIMTRRIAMQSAIGGMIFSLIGMGFAAAGYLSPVVGALLQELIDVIAIINALRLIWSSHIQTDLYDNQTT